MESVSISDNITRLCQCIHQTHNVPVHSNSVRNLRSRSYSILLKPYSVEDDLWDGTSEVLAHSCVLHEHEEHKRLCTLLDQLPQEDSCVESVLHFLALMAGKGSDVPSSSHNQTEVLSMPRIPKRCYQEFDISIFAAPEEPRYLRCASFPFDKAPGTGLSVLGTFGERRLSDSWRAGMENVHQQMVTALNKPRELMIPTAHIPSHDVLHYRDEGYGSPGDEQFRSLTISMMPGNEKCEENLWDIVLKVEMPQQRTWEALGSLDPPKEKHSPVEAGPEALRHAWLANMALEQMYHKVAGTQDILVPPMSRTEFVQDLKLLLMGLPSNTFPFNKELHVFEMKKKVHIDGITAETLAKYSRDFIVSGTCCSRLWQLVSQNSFLMRSCKEGLMFQALFESTQRYLKLHRAAVVSLPNGPLLHELRQRFLGLHIQISCLSQLFGIHPDLGTKEMNLPEGVKLLAHMYQQICRATSPDLACVLFFFFRSCCQVYFRLLEKWIFEGNCEQIHQEFFIQEVVDMMICRSREYWSKGHVLLHEAVPSFLRNYAEIIFQCGKALNLLKLCCPKNPLCSVLRGGFPSLRCCLQGSELQELKAECNAFYQRALEVCGEPMDIAGIFTAAEEQEKLLQTRAELLQKERMAKLLKEKQMRAQEAAKEKREQLAALKQQMEVATAQRDVEKQRELEEDRLRAQQYENEQQLVEEEKQKMVAHYATMLQLADQRRLQAEWRLKRIRLHDKRIELLSALDNVLGDNNNNAEQEPCDTENNNNNNTTNTCLESPLQSPDSPHVSELPLQSPDSPHVSESPLQSPDSSHVSESPLQSPDSPHIAKSQLTPDSSNVRKSPKSLQLSVDSPKVAESPKSPQPSLVSPKVAESPQLSLDSPNIPKSPKSLQRILDSPNIPESPKSPPRNPHSQHAPESLKSPPWNPRSQHAPELPKSPPWNPHSWHAPELPKSPPWNRHSLHGPELPKSPPWNRHSLHGPESPGQSQSAVEFCREQFKSAASARARNRQRVLESEFDIITGHHREEESQDSVVTVETPPAAATIEKETTEKNQVQILTALPHRDYKLPSGLGDVPMISVGATALPNQLPSTAFNISTFDASTVTATLQKSVVIPLEMQVKLVNSALIKYFLLELELVAHLSTLRNYFFLLDGEFSRSMTRVLFSRMNVVRSTAELLDCVALNSILARSLTLSSDPRAERFSFGVRYIPTRFSLSSPELLDSITLQYQVTWPLNIILTDTSLEKYNDVFLFLLRLRRISWVLEEDFHLLKHIDAGVQSSYQYHCVQLHRYEMTHFVRALQNYVTSTAIQGSWVEFQRSLQRAQTLEDLYRTHVNYVKNVRFRCLLNKQCAGIQKALSDLFKMILKFHRQLGSHSWQQVSGTNEYRHPHFSTLEEIYTCFHNIAVFTFKFAAKLANTGYLPHLWDLLQILNINSFYPQLY